MGVDLCAQLANELRETGTPAPISDVFARVRRHQFIPDRVWTEDGDEVVRSATPDAWHQLVYSDAPVTTQLDDGATGGWGVPTSSSSAPSIMATMLDAAAIEPGARVLEIGTATGYNAALLCELTGTDHSVTTVEVDTVLADQARTALAAAGYRPTVIAGDGALGCPGRAPFDRVVATCTVSRLPTPWVEQTRSGGVIVTPWSPVPSGPGGFLARLTVRDGAAEGRFVQALSFMWMRSHRDTGGRPHDLDAEPGSAYYTGHDPTGMLMDADRVLPLLLMVSGWRFGMRADADGRMGVWISATDSPSWARVRPADPGRWVIEQGGPRRLWGELETANRWWEQHGCPGVDQFGLTVSPRGHVVWLRSVDGPSWRHR